jgi:hypothetical protein
MTGPRGSHPEDWSGVRDRVIAVDRARWRSSSAQPIFERALTFDEIEEIEAEIGVALPDEYAAFLAEVGSGGPGPACELTTVRQVEGRWVWVWLTATDALSVPDMSGPFMDNDEWLHHQIETLRAAGHEPGVPDEHTGYLDAYRRAFGHGGDLRFHEERFRGAIHVGDDGCGATSWLAVVGPHRGEIWFRDCGIDPPLERLLDDQGTPHNFYTRYIDWLERREARAVSAP